MTSAPDREMEERLRAVERALTDGETAPAELEDAAAVRSALDEQAERTEALAERVADLEAAVEALRGYVGEVRAVNREVERRADAAAAAVEREDGVSVHPVPEADDEEGVLARVGEWL
ncbi:MAG: hypothetical protein ABEH77_10815 [Halobacteriaceae archaeon]